MPVRERKNVYMLPNGDQTLEWYARAVAEMRKRPTTDPTSWNFQAAIHGFRPDSPFWANAGQLPSDGERKEYWNQCQHGSWYFLPWHRMYLAYFEEIVADTIVKLGGPPNWALPFWDYSDRSNPYALNIPPAFTAGSPATNPLQMPNGGNYPGRRSTRVDARDVTLGALNNLVFQGFPNGASPGFGGPVTGFSHGGSIHGALESKPHDLVHVDIGGAMGSPPTAALDPIFWLHHANIDRLWQVWLNLGNRRSNPVDNAWLKYTFDFRNAQRAPTSLRVMDVVDTTRVLTGYTYQGVPANPPMQAMNKGFGFITESLFSTLKQGEDDLPPEVAAASLQAVGLNSAGTTIELPFLAANRRNSPVRSFHAKALHQENALEADVQTATSTYLNFENIIGKGVPPACDVYLNLDNGSAADESHYAGALAFFGIDEASTADERHSGSGQHYVLDISDVVNELQQQDSWHPEYIQVHLQPREPMDEESKVTIGRISLYVK